MSTFPGCSFSNYIQYTYIKGNYINYILVVNLDVKHVARTLKVSRIYKTLNLTTQKCKFAFFNLM